MKTRILFISAIIFLGASSAFSQTAPLPSAFQSWNQVQSTPPLVFGKDAKGEKIDKVSTTLSGVLRVRSY